MLNTIKETLLNIADFFSSLGSFVVGYIQELTSLGNKLSSTYDDITSLVDKFFPPALQLLVITLCSVILVLRVVGRF